MSENQALREALQELHDVFCEDDRNKAWRHRARLALIQTRKVLSTPAAMLTRKATLTDDEIIDIGNEVHRAMPVGSDDQEELIAIVRECFTALGQRNQLNDTTH